MIGRGLAICSLYSIVALVSTASAATGESVRVEVGRPQLVVDNTITQSPHLAGFKLSFDARFTNQSKTPVDIPDPDELRGGVVAIELHGAESQQSDGSWRVVVPGGTLAWKIDTVFADCKSLGPDETAELKEFSRPLVVFKSNLNGLLGTRATIRLYLEFTCQQREGKVLLKTVRTNPFVLSIPTLP
jgi:hypothetical protein